MRTALLPLYLHILIEVPASLNFLLRPSSFLAARASSAPPAASTTATNLTLLLRQYALLLLSTSVIAILLIQRGTTDALTRNISGALGIYHVGPVVRALWRVCPGQQSPSGAGSGVSRESLRNGSAGGDFSERSASVGGVGMDRRTRHRRDVIRARIADLGGPGLHFVVHALCFAGLGAVFLGWGS